jgi:hypothetical protein
MARLTAQQQSISDIARAVLVSTKPDELILLDSLVRDNATSRRDEMLGFGAGPELLLLSPVLISFLKEIATASACGEIVKGALKTIADDVGEKLGKVLIERPAARLDTSKLQVLSDEFQRRLQSRDFSATATASRRRARAEVISAHANSLCHRAAAIGGSRTKSF